MDVAGWLRSLGLSHYEEAFRDNSVDGDVLSDLTEDDLARLGVSLGDRKRLLKAIASLRSEEPVKRESQEIPASSADAAERRPITVLFCDLVGSTSISSELDAEDWRNLVGSYLDAASEAVTGFGGRVQDRFGDGLMVLFGYPQAYENDAERAVRAALAIQRALDELGARNAGKGLPQLVARIGLESGEVVVDATGAVFGGAPNVAARVQALAEPSWVFVTARVQRQIAGLFVAEDRGLHQLKGISTPVGLYRIIRASGAGRRSRAHALTPFIGREDELERLRERWKETRAGKGQLVLIAGEPGIGKSRLIQEFHAQLGATPHTWVEWSSSQLLQNTPLHPIVEWGRLRFGGSEAPDADRLAELDRTLRAVGLDAAVYDAVATLLVEAPLTHEHRTQSASEELRRRQLAAITAWVLAGARAQPIVLSFEDLQWADPTSLDLMRALAEHGAQAPLLIIATARPEFRPPWSASPHHSVVALTPLDRGEVECMIGKLAERHALSQDIVEGVTERSGGVPLFVEEVTRLLLDHRVEGGAPTIPPTLQQSLVARLDRLGPAREVARVGAVLGRNFSHGLVDAVAGLDEVELATALKQLAEADILFVEDDGTRTNYRFKHALIQDAAYESLLRSRRRALHQRAAEFLCDSPERAAAEPEAIARHFTEAGLDDLAIEWWGKAGAQALRRSAFPEAIAHLGKAIAMAEKADEAAPQGTGDSAATNPRLTQLHVDYGNALIAARGYAAPETTEAFARARQSASGDNAATERLAAAYGLWLGGYVRGELASMRVHAQAFLDGLAARPDAPESAVGHRIAGITRWFAGGYREARDHFERALAAFQPGRDDDLAFQFGFDPGVGAMGYLAFALWALGEVDRALSFIDRMQVRSAETTHAGTLAFASLHTALFEMMRKNPMRVEPIASELARLAGEHKLAFHAAAAVFLDGWVKAQSAAPDGLENMRRAIEQVREQKVLTFLDLGSITLAEAEARAGDPDRAIALIDDALATDERAGCHAFATELHRARGDILLQRDIANPEPAENAFLTAITIAKQQGTRSFELRAALSLAKLYAASGRAADASAVLRPALEGFPPASNLPEIGEALQLLASRERTRGHDAATRESPLRPNAN
jgi:class 3 adenylate cyclase/tetratricopeptide (TPR) repeat protein